MKRTTRTGRQSWSRRDFLKATALASTAVGLASLTAPWSGRAFGAQKLTVLVLGGTGFLGPPTVEYALARGHRVTLFNRGKTNPHLFPDLDRRQGEHGDADEEELIATHSKFTQSLRSSKKMPSRQG